jgi:hypothetical protein
MAIFLLFFGEDAKREDGMGLGLLLTAIPFTVVNGDLPVSINEGVYHISVPTIGQHQPSPFYLCSMHDVHHFASLHANGHPVYSCGSFNIDACKKSKNK